MRFLTITTWEVLDGADLDLMQERLETKRLPALKELGAERVQVVRTSDRTLAAISEWPNRQTRDEAEALINQVRHEVRHEDHSRMTGEMRGEVIAAV